MNHRNHRTCLLGLLAIAALLAPRAADACTTDSLDRGLTVRPPPQEERQIAGDGVLAFDAFIRGVEPEVALAQFALTLTPEGGGPPITGENSHRTLASQPYDDIDDYQEIVLVWRPSSPLAPGVYTAQVTLENDLFREWSFPVVVDAAAAPPLSPPLIKHVDPAGIVDEELERVCCETGQTSCGDHSVCHPTRVRVVPGFAVSATLEPADLERAYLWVAPWDGQAAGPPYERMNFWRASPDLSPWWSEWTFRHPIALPDAAGERCVVVGATSLIDGSTALSRPFCHTLEAAHEEARTPMFDPGDSDIVQCLGPPVYEHDGSPYPPEPDGGCRLAATRPGPLLALLLLIARRRRGANGRLLGPYGRRPARDDMP